MQIGFHEATLNTQEQNEHNRTSVFSQFERLVKILEMSTEAENNRKAVNRKVFLSEREKEANKQLILRLCMYFAM